MKRQPVRIVCIGGGGHARVVMDAICSAPEQWNLIGYTDPADRHSMFPYLGEDKVLEELLRGGARVAVLGVGSIGNWKNREHIARIIDGYGFQWGVVKQPTRIVQSPL